MMKTAVKLKSQERARSIVYRRLADVFRMPGSDMPMILDELESALAGLDSDACGHAALLKKSYHDPSAPCSLAVDYAGLFVGPFLVPAPPYGSVYLEDNRQLMGVSTIDVRQHYLSQGFDLSPDFKDAPDHISAELEFMHVLVMQGLEAVNAADHQLLSENIHHQRVFLEQHLSAWIPSFTEKMTEYARTDFYRNLAAVTRTFVAEEMEALPDLPGKG
jgi:TorA maturation chaperone TorD